MEVLLGLESMSDDFWDHDKELMRKFLRWEVGWNLGCNESRLVQSCHVMSFVVCCLSLGNKLSFSVSVCGTRLSGLKRMEPYSSGIYMKSRAMDNSFGWIGKSRSTRKWSCGSIR